MKEVAYSCTAREAALHFRAGAARPLLDKNSPKVCSGVQLESLTPYIPGI